LIFEGAYCSYFNTGFSISEVINYANVKWLTIMEN